MKPKRKNFIRFSIKDSVKQTNPKENKEEFFFLYKGKSITFCFQFFLNKDQRTQEGLPTYLSLREENHVYVVRQDWTVKKYI